MRTLQLRVDLDVYDPVDVAPANIVVRMRFKIEVNAWLLSVLALVVHPGAADAQTPAASTQESASAVEPLSNRAVQAIRSHMPQVGRDVTAARQAASNHLGRLAGLGILL